MFATAYQLELDALWSRLRRVWERISRLERLFARDADGRVGRLIQSGAFAFASAQERLHDDGQAYLRPLIAEGLPTCLRPRPASTILEFPMGSSFFSDAKDDIFHAEVKDKQYFGANVKAPFRVMWSTLIRPLRITEARIDRLHAHQQVMRIGLAVAEGVSLPHALREPLRFFLHELSAGATFDLLDALRSARVPIGLKAFDGRGRTTSEHTLPPEAFRWVRVDTAEPPLVSARRGTFPASVLLEDLFAFPESFAFFDLNLADLNTERAERVEITLPLRNVVETVANLDPKHVRLFCAPATNEYVADIESLRARDAKEWTLSVVDKPHAEILEVRGLYTDERSNAHGRREVLSWESPDEAHTLEDGQTYYVLEQKISKTEPRTQMKCSFATTEQFFAPAPAPVVEGEVLATDGAAVATVKRGDVQRLNLTDVAPSYRARLGKNLGWRMGAYARMPGSRFAESVHVNEWVGLHAFETDPRARPPVFSNTRHELVHRLGADGLFQWGDAVTLDVERGGWSPGQTWLLGELLARAIAERSEPLRYSRLTLVRRQGLFAQYEARDGQRLPFPLG